MKKYLLIILIVFTAVLVSGCITDDADDNGIKTVTKNGVVLKYPSEWVVSQATSNISLVSVSASSSIDSDKIGNVNVNVEKKPLTAPLNVFINQTSTAMSKDSSFTLISSGEVLVGDKEGIEIVYQSEVNGTLKKHKAVWVEHNNNAVVILCSAPASEFDSNLKVFDFIIENIVLL